MIIKELQIQFNNIRWLLLGGILLISCQLEDSKKVSESRVNTIDQVLAEVLYINPNKGIAEYNGSPFTGNAVGYFNNGQMAISTDYVDGKKDGLLKKWFPDGKMSYSAQYLNGKQDGVSKSWWVNGKIRSEARHQKGVVHGEQKQWYKSGQLFKELKIKQGKEDGLQRSWRENGKLYNNYEAKNGRIFGLKRSKLCFQLEDEEIQYGEK